MTFLEVQAAIETNVAFLIEHSPSDELRDKAVELAADLKATDQVYGVGRYRERGQHIAQLTRRVNQRDARLVRENHVLRARLAAIGRLITV